MRNKFSVGDEIDIIHPLGNKTIKVEYMLDRKDNKVEVAQGSGVFVKLPNMIGFENALLARIINHSL